MRKDIKKAYIKTNYEKIITKHEWMIAAIDLLEKDQPNNRDETP